MAANEPESFGVLLSRYRAAAGLTQEELAERTGLSVRGISDLERGARTQPRLSTIHQLAEALQLSRDDRATFERAGLAPSRFRQLSDGPPEGTFLGALPAGELVAREEEGERFRAALDALAEEAGHLLLLGGERGVGKTRLLQELMVDARARGYVVATARCDGSEQGTAYYPFLEALSGVSASVSGRLGAEVQRSWKRIQQLTAGGVSGSDAAESSAVKQRELLGAVSDLLQRVARSVPVALLLDDLHWADDHSLKLVQHLAHTTGSSRILIAATFRDARLTEEHPALAHMLQILNRERLAERITVRRLSLEETTQLVSVTMGQQEVSEEFASFVYRRTKGIPRLIDQLVRSLGGRLELQGEIGAGSVGRVFRAYDRDRAQEVAAKLVLSRQEIDLDTLLRFQQEGAVLARLEHPNIVDVYDTFAEEHASCIVMELLEGQSLGQILRAGSLALVRARQLALQVAEALSYAHSQQIVHRDIKPDNVMVLDDDRVKVTDFGIARLLQPDTSLQTIATTGMRMGTPLYMAPEQIEGKKIDGRTDIYALGAMLYHMVTGRPPFEGSDALTVAVKHLQEEPVSPSQIEPAIPATWDAVILRAMAKDPTQRFQRAAEMKEAIAALPTEPVEAWAARVERGDEIASRALSPRNVTTTPGRRRTAATTRAGGAAAAVLAVALALWLVLAPPWSASRAHAFNGNPISVWGVKIPHSFAFQDPIILSSPVHGDLYVGDYAHGAIVRLSTRTGKLLAAWGSKGTGFGQFRAINDIAVDGHGNLYITDELNNRITVMSPDGRPLRSFGHRGVNPGEFYHPSALTLDAQGNVYVADAYNDRIQKVSATGKPLLAWGSAGHAPGQVFGPNAIRLDRHGNVWVTEHVNLRVHEFSPDGKSLAIFARPGKRLGELTDPQALAFDRAGNIYVLEEQLERIQKFSPAGKLLAVWAASGNHSGFKIGRGSLFDGLPRLVRQASGNYPEFKDISTISIDSQGRVYVADPGNGQVHILTTGGKLLANWNVRALLRQLFQQPAYVALAPRGNTYVSDQGRNEIEKVSPAGNLLLHWGRRGSGPGLFLHPSGIALDTAGNVHVADTGNGRIQEFTSSGRFITQWRTQIPGTKRRGHPVGLAVDRQGNVYVSDPVNNLVQGFSRSHRLFIQWGHSDRNHPFYWLKRPRGIAVDRQGNVYVADTGNNRVLEFAPTEFQPPAVPIGKPLRSWGGTRGTGAGQFLEPTGVVVDSRGNVYVTDAAASRVQEFTAGGKLIARWGRAGSDPGSFKAPTGIALDAAGNVYVADSGNSRIQTFRPVS